LAKYFSEEYFKEVETRLNSDAKWQDGTKNLKTTLVLAATDQSAGFSVAVENGKTTIQRVEPNFQAEFAFEGPYEVWTRVARGELDFQAAVLKGSLRFRGSITKILFYRDRFVRIAEVIREVPKEF